VRAGWFKEYFVPAHARPRVHACMRACVCLEQARIDTAHLCKASPHLQLAPPFAKLLHSLVYTREREHSGTHSCMHTHTSKHIRRTCPPTLSPTGSSGSSLTWWHARMRSLCCRCASRPLELGPLFFSTVAWSIDLARGCGYFSFESHPGWGCTRGARKHSH